MFALGSGYWPVLLFSIDWGLRLLLAGVVISRRRPVAVTLAWLAVLVFVPVIGLIAYVLVGENRLGRRRIRRYEVLTKGIEVEAVRVWHHRHLDSQGIDEMYAPIARFASPEEVASYFLFLCSPRASYSVGSTYFVDGGMLKTV